MQKFLSQLLPAFACQPVAADGVTPADRNDIADILVNALVFDSREVRDGALYFALPGAHADGNDFIPDAVAAGAAAVVFQGGLSHEVRLAAASAIAKRQIEAALAGKSSPPPAFLRTADARLAMSPVSDAFYDSPSGRLAVIGVTGTEGKSSAVSFIWQLLRACGKKAGFISTVEYSLGGDALPNPHHQTTPEAPVVQSRLHAMLENGCEFAVVEASSHGLSARLNRLGDVAFDCGVFMNVTLEHLEFHKTFEQYRSDKANLFRALDRFPHEKTIAGRAVTVPAAGIVNLDDESAQYFAEATRKPVYGFSAEGFARTGVARTAGGPSLAENGVGNAAGAENGVGNAAGAENSAAAGDSADAENGTRRKEMRRLRAADISDGKDGLSFTIEMTGGDGPEQNAPSPGESGAHTAAAGDAAAAENSAGAGDAAVSAPERTARPDGGAVRVTTALRGAFNAYNVMAAMLAVHSVAGAPLTELAEKAGGLVPVRGRMTVIGRGQPFELIVDYAHTPSSFEAILPPLRGRCRGRIFALFGSGGERDLTKRPLQGQIAARFCDVIVLADEDPRGEDPVALLKMIAAGAEREGKKEGRDLFIIHDRKQAIRETFRMAGGGDLVLLLGKSHENSIIYKDFVMPYDEIAEAETALSELGYCR